MQTLIMILCAFGAAFFLMRGLQAKIAMRSMTNLELRRAERDDAARKEERASLRVRLGRLLARNGYDGNLFPLVAGIGFLYLFLLVLLHVVGMGYQVGVVVALPTSIAVCVGIFSTVAKRRKRKFNAQLIELLDLMSSQVQAGNGTHKALTLVVPTMQEPMRGEMTGVLDDFAATKDLIGAIRLVADKYPSRAMSMFISALEIDKAEGQAIGPALRQASELLKQQFALAAEANAEISQTRGEFLVLIGIVAAISAKMIFGSGPEAIESFTSGVGLIAISVGIANMGAGVWRFFRILDKVRGDK